MQFLCLIYETESLMAQQTEQQSAELIQEYMTYTDKITESGHFVAGDALQPTSTATTVRVRNGEVLITDGPFAETKEQLGGYYLLECDSLDEAINKASQIPSAKLGSIEVRPIMVFN
jgi:hypothetical protein